MTPNRTEVAAWLARRLAWERRLAELHDRAPVQPPPRARAPRRLPVRTRTVLDAGRAGPGDRVGPLPITDRASGTVAAAADE